MEGSRFAGAAVKIGYTLAGQPQESEVAASEMTVTDTTDEGSDSYDAQVVL